MHNFGNTENNLEILAYKHVLDYSIQNYGHFSGCAKSITWEFFHINLVGTYWHEHWFKD